eukprot:366277-Chlamydomonas_euryale.AAC.4
MAPVTLEAAGCFSCVVHEPNAKSCSRRPVEISARYILYPKERVSERDTKRQPCMQPRRMAMITAGNAHFKPARSRPPQQYAAAAQYRLPGLDDETEWMHKNADKSSR